ncbi:MAG: PQQ-binding-like beta-propeller repeat protein [Acidobacteriota bacterium]
MRMLSKSIGVTSILLACVWAAPPGSPVSAAGQAPASQAASLLPDTPLTFGAFTATFARDGSFSLVGQGWSPLKGNWTALGDALELTTTGGEKGCDGSGRYTFRQDGIRLTLKLQSDTCENRRLILDSSVWVPAGTPVVNPERRIVRTSGAARGSLPAAAPAAGQWPSFRGIEASGVARDQHLPDRWDASSGEHILWRTAVPGLAHSSPVVWGNRLFVTTAVSSDPKATFRKGLYGDGDASSDRSRHRFVVIAFDTRTGKPLWQRTAFEGEPLNKRHIKSTYASASPATDGRIVVAWFGSQGVAAYDVDGTLRWKVDLGRIDLGAYDIPSVEWGPASSPIIWKDLVILQVDTQADSFLLALNASTGETVWKTERDEWPSWGTPTVAETAAGPVLVTNASKFIRGYDPRTGKEMWRLGGSSKITAPTPISTGRLLIIASGRAPERPIFVVRPGAQGDLTLAVGKTSSDAVVWSKTGRGSYMPTPLALDGVLYVLGNNGVFDAYSLETGEEVYRQRLPVVGSGYSASPVAADGKIYLSGEDGDILVVAAGPEFKVLATNAMGESLMATPALSDGVMYIRGLNTLFAVSSKTR